MTHMVNQIADALVDLLTDSTVAEDRVFRDREPDIEARSELPAVVVLVGQDDPVDDQVHGRWRSQVRIHVDLLVTDAEDQISKTALALRSETYRLIMADHTLGIPGVISVTPGGAEDVRRLEGSLPVAFLRTVFFILYQHSFTDPDR